ncbi:MAG TPA: iron-containing redox enzyme family protein [Aeromicrobium sp.]|nr:iron-containing redox enzyme family protein [Aeromicrobium sp.]
MRLPSPRGALSQQLFAALGKGTALAIANGPTDEDDLQISLWALYELHYRGFDQVDDGREWDPQVLALRARLEVPFETSLRRRVAGTVRAALDHGPSVVDQLTHICERRGSGLPRFLERKATADQFREFLMTRSDYHLKESDPQAWALPRTTGHAKAALAELLYDEFGNGSGERVHQELFATAMQDAGLVTDYGSYIDQTPAHVLTVNNAMSLLGLHRRLRGASLGHLAAFEMTSTAPSRRIARGAERLGFGPAVAAYYDEHVEADAVHEQLASRSICGSLVAAEPRLRDDVLLGAALCVVLEKASGTRTLQDWADGRSALRPLRETVR